VKRQLQQLFDLSRVVSTTKCGNVNANAKRNVDAKLVKCQCTCDNGESGCCLLLPKQFVSILQRHTMITLKEALASSRSFAENAEKLPQNAEKLP
jgi:hypothetical protein